MFDNNDMIYVLHLDYVYLAPSPWQEQPNSLSLVIRDRPLGILFRPCLGLQATNTLVSSSFWAATCIYIKQLFPTTDPIRRAHIYAIINYLIIAIEV